MLQPNMQSIKKENIRFALDAENIRVVSLSRDAIALIFSTNCRPMKMQYLAFFDLFCNKCLIQ